MMKNLIEKLFSDHGSWWVSHLHNYRMGLKKGMSGLLSKPVLFIKGIETGKGCDYYGIPHFHREPFSSIKIGNNCRFRSDQASNLIGVNHKCIISTQSPEAQITIGDDCGFSGTTIGAACEIQIGNNVLVGANVIITDHDWHTDRSNTKPKPVIIRDNAWIGVNSTILKGVTIGRNSIIGANSLVVNDIPDNVVAGGNPCKVLKKL